MESAENHLAAKLSGRRIVRVPDHPCTGSPGLCSANFPLLSGVTSIKVAIIKMERVKGIEPSYAAWEAAVLPLNYTRIETRTELYPR